MEAQQQQQQTDSELQIEQTPQISKTTLSPPDQDQVSGVSSALSNGGLVTADDNDRSGGAAALFFTRGSIARRILESTSFMGVQSQRYFINKRVGYAFFVLEMIQLLTFALVPEAVFGSSLESAFSIISRLRNPLGSAYYPVLFWVFVGGCGGAFLAFFVIAFSIYRGDTGRKIIFQLIAFCVDFQRFAIIPMIYIIRSPLLDNVKGSAEDMISFIICFLMSIGILFFDSFIGLWRPSQSLVSSPLTLFFSVTIFSKSILVTLQCLFQFYFGTGTVSSIIAGAVVLFIISSFLLIWIVLFLPFIHIHVDCVAAGVYSALLWGSVATIACALKSDATWRLGWGIAIICGCIVFGVLGGLGTLFRIKHPSLPLPFMPKPEIEEASFKTAIAYELAARNITRQRRTTPGMIDRANALFEEGLQAFPTSIYLKLSYAVFLLDRKSDIPRLKLLLKNVIADRTNRPKIPVSIGFYFIACSIKQSLHQVNDEDQTELETAEIHRKAAQEKLTDFWARVARSKKLLDHNALLAIVTELMNHEKIADSIYRRVLSRNVHSPLVMRQYARFLEEICDEKDRAEVLFQEADKNEEHSVKQSQKKEKKKHARGIRFGQQAVARVPGVVITDTSPLMEPSGEQEDEEGGEIQGGNLSQPVAGSEKGKESEGSHVGSVESGISSVSLQSSASANATSEERVKLQEYRTKIAKLSNRGVQSACASVISFILAIYAVFIVSFILSSTGIKNTEKGAIVARSMMTVSTDIHDCLEQMQEDRFYQTFNLSKFQANLAEMHENLFAASDNSVSDEVLLSWIAIPVNVSSFERPTYNATEYEGTYENEQVLLWDGLNMIIDSLEMCYSLLNQSRNGEYKNNPSWRFAYGNAMTITDMTTKAAIAMCKSTDEESQILSTKIGLYIGIACAVMLALLCALLYPILSGFERKRQSIVRIFSEVPKSASLNIYERMQRRDPRDHVHHQKMTLTVHELMAPMPRLGTRLVLSVLMIAIFACATALSFFVVSSSTSGIELTVVESGNQQVYLTMLRGMISILSHPTDNEVMLPPVVSKAVIASIVQTIRDSDDSLEIAGIMEGDLMTLWYSRPCPKELEEINITCKGLDAYLHLYLDAAIAISTSPVPLESNPAYTLLVVGYNTLNEWMEDSETIIVERAMSESHRMLLACNWILIASFPILAMIAISVLPPIVTIVNTTNRALNLLLLVPLSVLNREENIKAYLESSATLSTTSMKMLMDDQEKKTKLILDACADAVIISDNRGIIETVNPSAERLVGKTADELIGSKISALMSLDTAKIFERGLRATGSGEPSEQKKAKKKSFTIGDNTDATFIHHDGTRIHVLLTSLVTTTGEGSVVATFVRDIRRIKEREQEFERERRRVDALLLNILPPSIADTLKRSPGASIAKKYSGVTVCFAEVCDFNKITEKMDPIELVRMLNDVFTPWDKLSSDCDSGVEKIKSFGACWMGASGLPAERADHAEVMINFVICALEEIEKLNSKRVSEGLIPISFRVGIHSGSVVAGVIGFLKFCFDIWGDSVNVASRMETNGIPNRVQVSPATLNLVRDKFEFVSRGLVPLKGKGEIECYLLKEGQKPTRKLTPDATGSGLPFLKDLNF